MGLLRHNYEIEIIPLRYCQVHEVLHIQSFDNPEKIAAYAWNSKYNSVKKRKYFIDSLKHDTLSPYQVALKHLQYYEAARKANDQNVLAYLENTYRSIVNVYWQTGSKRYERHFEIGYEAE